MRLLLAIFLLGTTALAQEPAPSEPAPPEVESALVLQERLPALEARHQAAQARVEARQAFFAGEAELAAAFPRLGRADLLTPSVVAGHLALLDQAGTQRALEAAEDLPEVPEAEALRSRLLEAHSAEEQADLLARRLLLAVRARTSTAPDLIPAVLAARERAQQRKTEAEAEAAVEEPTPEALTAVALADQQVEQLRALEVDLVALAAHPQRAYPQLERDLALLDGERGAEAAAERLELWQAAGGPDEDFSLRLAMWRAEHPRVASAPVEEEVPEAPEGEGSLDAKADRSRTDASEARRVAEQARRDAQTAEALRSAELQESWATAQERATATWSALQEARVTQETRQAELSEQLDELSARIDLVVRLPVMNQDRPDPDQVFADACALVGTLRQRSLDQGHAYTAAHRAREEAADRVQADRRALSQAQQRLAGLADRDLAADQQAILDRWAQALDDEERAATEAVDAARAHRQQALLQLDLAKDLRREVEPWASRTARSQVAAQWPEELRQELALLGPFTSALVRDRVDDAQEVPSLFSDATRVWNVLSSALLLILFLGAWVMARRRVGWVVELVLQRVRFLQRLGQVSRLKEPVVAALVPAVDLFALILLLGRVSDQWPELALVLLVVLQVSIYKVLLATFDLLVVASPETRPALRVVARPVHAQARATVRVLLLWVILRQFTTFLTLDVLGADTLAWLLRLLFALAGVVLVVWLLHRWEPALRGRMAREHQGNRAVARLSRGPVHPSLAAIWSLADLAFLGAKGVADLAYRLAREGSGLGQVLNLLGRYRMTEPEAEVVPEALSEDVGARIVSAGMPMVSREGVVAELEAHRAAWERERRRGMVAVLGDRGEGRRILLRAYADLLQGQGIEVCAADLDHRLHSEAEALQWLASSLGLPEVPASVEDAVSAIEALSSRVLVLERAHMSFLRTVGGFEALRSLLYVLNATSDHHLWVVGFHRPAWAYLSRLGDLANLEVFRAAVPLPPLGEKDVRALAVGRTREAGYEPDFSGLVGDRLLGGDPEVEAERSTTLFFRLLAETSDGNGAVALRLWRDCLSPSDQPGVLRVRMGEGMAARTLTGLTDVHLFALAALRTMEVLDEEELVQVTNMAAASIRQAVKHLRSRRLLDLVEGRVQIAYDSLPAVTRSLRRRHFVHWN